MDEPEEPSHQVKLEYNLQLKALTKELEYLHQGIYAEEGQPTESLQHIEQKLQQLSISLNPPVHTEPIGEVLKHYTDTLCFTQKQTNFTNTLLQDITIFTGHDAMQLETWLVDIEMAADLSVESRTKLTQAKSRGLACTLITEAHNQANVGMTSRIYYV